ncbi:hypothetical protein C5167_027190 [Papaver somniferum]|nr:hypothetical protein C5167_027190 [Papaver somniferum]
MHQGSLVLHDTPAWLGSVGKAWQMDLEGPSSTVDGGESAVFWVVLAR